MNASEIERELDELETRIERLRALYEQYFMGLEKLEPLIVRKDVDRRIWVLRRVQIRNTALRFKFQTLVQRYNTFQQYWLRITREIENGTYRRDVVRVARRFGAKEALTILGRKRAQKYADLAAIQAAQADRRRRGDSEFLEELSDDDLLEDEEGYEAFLSDDEIAEDVDEAFSDLSDGSAKAEPEAAVRGTPKEDVEAKTIPAPARRGRSGDGLRALRIPRPPPVPALKDAEPSAKAAWAGAPGPADGGDDDDEMEKTIEFRKLPMPRPSDPEAAKRRLIELAAEMKSQRGMSANEIKEMQEMGGPLELDLDFAEPRTQPPKKTTRPPPKRSSTAKMPAVKGSAGPGSGRSGAGSTRRTTRSMKAVRVPTPAPAEKPKSRPPVNRGEELGEQRLKQIYDKYIETRQGTNEPVAGMTYEKVADSLKTQADKLRSMHPGKRVDYEVVVKNGKTLLKPILR